MRSRVFLWHLYTKPSKNITPPPPQGFIQQLKSEVSRQVTARVRLLPMINQYCAERPSLRQEPPTNSIQCSIVSSFPSSHGLQPRCRPACDHEDLHLPFPSLPPSLLRLGAFVLTLPRVVTLPLRPPSIFTVKSISCSHSPFTLYSTRMKAIFYLYSSESHSSPASPQKKMMNIDLKY